VIIKRNLVEAIDRHNANISTVARDFRFSRQCIYRYINKYDLLDLVKEKRRNSHQSDFDYDANGESIVYLIKESFNGYIKIGVSRNIKGRMAAIESNIPQKITLIGTIKSSQARKIEEKLHRKYADYCIKGEWFKLSDKQLSELIFDNNFEQLNT